MGAVRRLALVTRLAETWFHRPSSPRRLVLDLTRRCNLRCEMCHTWQAPPSRELSATEIGAVLRRLDRVVWLDLTGGEPFVRADIDDILAQTIASCPALGVLHFQTNGWMTDRIAAATRRLRRGFDGDLIVTVSIDGPPEVHDRIRGRQGSFDRAMATARSLQAIDDVDVHIGTTVTPSNLEHLDALEGLLAEFAPRRWHFNWLQVSEHFFRNGHLRRSARLTPDPRVREQLRRRGVPRTLVEAMESLFLLHLHFYRRGEAVGIPCQALRSAMFISPEGDVYPCHVYDRPLGNVRQRDVLEIWHSREVGAARRDIEKLACGGCFTPCEAYPTLAGSPLRTITRTISRAARILTEGPA